MSKSFAAKLLLVLYLGVSCRPVLPVLADVAAHVLFYQHHYETVHAHYGQFHVHDEVAAAAEADSGKQEAPISSKSFPVKDLSAHLPVLPEGLALSSDGSCPSLVHFFYAQKQGIDKPEILTPPPDVDHFKWRVDQKFQGQNRAYGA